MQYWYCQRPIGLPAKYNRNMSSVRTSREREERTAVFGTGPVDRQLSLYVPRLALQRKTSVSTVCSAACYVASNLFFSRHRYKRNGGSSSSPHHGPASSGCVGVSHKVSANGGVKTWVEHVSYVHRARILSTFSRIPPKHSLRSQIYSHELVHAKVRKMHMSTTIQKPPPLLCPKQTKV